MVMTKNNKIILNVKSVMFHQILIIITVFLQMYLLIQTRMNYSINSMIHNKLLYRSRNNKKGCLGIVHVTNHKFKFKLNRHKLEQVTHGLDCRSPLGFLTLRYANDLCDSSEDKL